MKSLTAAETADAAGATLAAGSTDTLLSGAVSTDSRKLPEGCLFVGLSGPNFDGSSFAAAALEAGARAVLVRSWRGPAPEGRAVLTCEDPLLALQKLARWWRMRLDIPVVGITGSNGKTSTKDFTAAVLSKRFAVSATAGNLNNHIGVPLTVLATEESHGAAVWEMGMNHAGEIAPLCGIARPGYGIITNIGTAHIEFLGSRDAIAEEKGALARSLPAEGFLFLPARCEYHAYFRERCRAPIIPVGNGRGLVRAENLATRADGSDFTLVIDGAGEAAVSLPVPGRHMVVNSLLAAAAGWKLGVPVDDIAAALSSVRITSGRLRRFTSRGVTVIDDTYNANPESMAAAIETLAETPLAGGSRRVIVLGRMGELGEHAPAAHLATGELAARRGLTLIAVGEGAEGIARGAGNAPWFAQADEAAAWLNAQVREGDAVLFKGSRAAAVETVMNKAFPAN